jgi:hypothetical protein
MTQQERLLAAWERIRDKRRAPTSLEDALKVPVLARLIHMAAAYYDHPAVRPLDGKQRQAGEDLFKE